jgi:hypothetical protein
MVCTILVIGRAAAVCLELLLGVSLFVLFFASAATAEAAACANFVLRAVWTCCCLPSAAEEAAEVAPVPARIGKAAFALPVASVTLDADEPPDAAAGAAAPLEAGETAGRREVELLTASVRHEERAFASRTDGGDRLAAPVAAAAASATAAPPLPTAAELERVRRGVAAPQVDIGAPERMLLVRVCLL